jgi:hypothetical protein
MSKEIGTITVSGIGSISIKDDKSLDDAKIFLELLRNRVRQKKKELAFEMLDAY